MTIMPIGMHKCSYLLIKSYSLISLRPFKTATCISGRAIIIFKVSSNVIKHFEYNYAVLVPSKFMVNIQITDRCNLGLLIIVAYRLDMSNSYDHSKVVYMLFIIIHYFAVHFPYTRSVQY